MLIYILHVFRENLNRFNEFGILLNGNFVSIHPKAADLMVKAIRVWVFARRNVDHVGYSSFFRLGFEGR